MTQPLSLFLDSTAGIEVVRDAVASIIGHPFARQDNNTGAIYKSIAFCIEWVFYGNHELVDDCGIEFSQYEYQLQMMPFWMSPEQAEYDSFYERCALFVASRLSVTLACRILVVANLQHKVATFSR